MRDLLSQYIKENQLFDKEIAVACSAGVDSMVLLDTLLKVHPKDKILCLHLDHGWRKDSNNCVEFLNQYCKENEIKFLSKSYKHGEMDNDENTARKLRYEFFLEACKEFTTDEILLAHNLDDDVETIAFRLIRGTSSSGLTGIPSKRLLEEQIHLHRPFLGSKKSEIEEYAKAKNIRFIEDSTNLDTNYARNKIRLEIMPLLETINPSAKDNIHSLSKIIEEEHEYLEEITDKTLEDFGELPWDLEPCRALPKTILRRALEKTFTTNIKFCNDFMRAIEQGGFHKINFAKEKFFTIRKKQIHLEYN